MENPQCMLPWTGTRPMVAEPQPCVFKVIIKMFVDSSFLGHDIMTCAPDISSISFFWVMISYVVNLKCSCKNICVMIIFTVCAVDTIYDFYTFI
jgi:hypothetical protein